MLAFVACRTAAPLAPAPVSKLATEDAAAIRADVAEANRTTGVEWRAVESLRFGGFSFERYELEGGPTLLLALGAEDPAVTIQTWFGTGARDDGEDPGLAAALIDAVRETGSVPGEHVAAVAWHASYWSTTTSPDHFDDAVAASKQRRSPDAAWSRIEAGRRAWSMARLWAKVEREAAQRFTSAPLEEDALGEAAARFAPGRSTIVIAGAVDRRGALVRVGQVYGDVQAAPRQVEAPVVPSAPRAPFEIGVPGAMRRAFVWWPLGDASVADHVALEAIGQVVAARIGREASTSGIVAVEVHHRPGPTGALAVQMELGDTMTATVAAERVREVVADLGRGGTTGREVERALASTNGTRWRTIASLEGRAFSAARAYLEHGGLFAMADAFAAIEGMGERDLRRVATEWLVKRRPTVLLTRPERSGS